VVNTADTTQPQLAMPPTDDSQTPSSLGPDSESDSSLKPTVATPFTTVCPPPNRDDSPEKEYHFPARPDPADVRFTPIPDSWFDYGTHKEIADMTARVYAITANWQKSAETLAVRYIHPVNDATAHLTYQAIKLPSGPVPAPAHDEQMGTATTAGNEFYFSIGLPGLTVETDFPAPTPAERQLLWAIHGPSLVKSTCYRPDVPSDR